MHHLDFLAGLLIQEQMPERCKADVLHILRQHHDRVEALLVQTLDDLQQNASTSS
jgi:hypothetical protein